MPTEATHYIELRHDSDYYPAMFHNNYLELLAGAELKLQAYDSEGHVCRIMGLASLNPAYTTPPTGNGEIETLATCTEVGDHTIYAECMITQQQFPVSVRVKHIEITPRNIGGTYQVVRGSWVQFSVIDAYWDSIPEIWYLYLLNPTAPVLFKGWDAYVQCTELGSYPVVARCPLSGEWDYTYVSVQTADLKINMMDAGESGFFQAVVGQTLTISLVASEGSPCRILDLDQLDPTLPATVTGLGSVSVQRICKSAGEEIVIRGKNDVTGETDDVQIHVSEIAQTGWGAINGSLDPNPNPGGGQRSFPDWVLADFPNGPYPPRNWVQVYCWIDPPPSDPNQPLALELTPYDPDDPSANAAPVDIETNPTDNRGGPGFWPLNIPQNPYNKELISVALSGHAGAVFQVSPNPGDNFRVNTHLVGTPLYTCYAPNPDPVGEGRILRTDTQQPPRSQEVTGLLTVWRRLHVECDTMAYTPDEVVQANCGILSSGVYEGYLDEGSPQVYVIDQLVPGVLYDSNYPYSGGPGTCFSIFSNTAGNPFTFTTDYPGPSGLLPLYDDDFNLLTCPPSPRWLLPQWPDLSIAQTAYRDAYIEVDDEQFEWNSTMRPLLYQVAGENQSAVVQHRDRGAYHRGQDAYWISYVLNSFQWSPDRSADPEAPATLGICIAISDPDDDWGGCGIYLETIRDRNEALQINHPPGMTVAHEIAHSIYATEDPVTQDHAYTARSILEKVDNRQFKVEGNLPVSGFNIVPGSIISIVWGPANETLAYGYLDHYVNGPNDCMIYLQTIFALNPMHRGSTMRLLSIRPTYGQSRLWGRVSALRGSALLGFRIFAATLTARCHEGEKRT